MWYERRRLEKLDQLFVKCMDLPMYKDLPNQILALEGELVCCKLSLDHTSLLCINFEEILHQRQANLTK